MKYPETKKENIKDLFFGTKDSFRWLEDDIYSETEKWVQTQNNFTQNFISKISFKNSIKNNYDLKIDYFLIPLLPFKNDLLSLHHK